MTAPAELRVLKAARQACRLEAWARKPGNVSRASEWPGLRYADFLASADAVAPELARAGNRPLGDTILAAIRATQAAVATNTNLGIVLLLAPLCQTVRGPFGAWPHRVAAAIAETTVADTAAVYEAIRLAAPGGMGKVQDQDVADAPTVTLQAAMALAADRDLIARQYAHGFREVFEVAAPALADSLAAGLAPEEAIVACQLRFLAAYPDTLISRQRGSELATEASARAAEFLPHLDQPGWFQDGAATAAFDHWLRSQRANPGTTADFIAAALFVELERENPHLTNFAAEQ